jgi:hypothetical protein
MEIADLCQNKASSCLRLPVSVPACFAGILRFGPPCYQSQRRHICDGLVGGSCCGVLGLHSPPQ